LERNIAVADAAKLTSCHQQLGNETLLDIDNRNSTHIAPMSVNFGAAQVGATKMPDKVREIR
jgi:hypothetical protein